MTDNKRILEAIHFAALAHQSQVRKGSGIPYITHPLAVGLILSNHQFPESWIIAGILHDTLEDTAVSAQDLQKHFGAEIAGIVIGCSEPDHRTLPWQDRKAHTIAHLATASEAVRIVTCADKLHNLLSLERDLKSRGKDTWSRFNAGEKLQRWYYFGVLDVLRQANGSTRHPQILNELGQAVARVFP